MSYETYLKGYQRLTVLAPPGYDYKLGVKHFDTGWMKWTPEEFAARGTKITSNDFIPNASYKDYKKGYEDELIPVITQSYSLGVRHLEGGIMMLTETVFNRLTRGISRVEHFIHVDNIVIYDGTGLIGVTEGQIGVVRKIMNDLADVCFDAETKSTHRCKLTELKIYEQPSAVSGAQCEKLVIYVSGPVTGLPLFNYPLFNEVTEKLRAEGHRVYNPAEFWKKSHGEFPMRQAFAVYCNFICLEADAIYLLPGYERSQGAQLELALAAQCNLKIIHHSE